MGSPVRKDRRGYILAALQAQSAVTVVELSEGLRLSEVTVRKLLDMMEREGLLRRTWGGAVSALGSIGDHAYEEKIVRHLAHKQAIARVAYEMIGDGDAVYLDSGTTTLQLAALLAAGEKRRVLVATNALNIAMAFRAAEDMQVILIGGTFHHNIVACGGGLARDMLRGLYFDKGFLTGSHFSPAQGFTTPNLYEAEAKRAAMEACKETIALADFSKYGNASLAAVAECGRMGMLVTDWRATDEAVTALREAGMRVIRAAQS